MPLIRLKYRCPRAISATYNRYLRLRESPDLDDLERQAQSEGLELVAVTVIR